MNFGYWPEVQRGNERIVHDLATELARNGHRTSILTSHPGRPTRTWEEGVRVVRSWRPPESPLRARRIQENLTHLPFSYLELIRGDFDVAQASFATDATAAARWTRRTGRPSVFSFTGIFGRENVSSVRMRRRVVEAATSEVSVVLALSEAARDSIWRWLAVEARVIYPGVDLKRFSPGTRAAAPTIGCAADVTDARKRVPLLVSAFGLLRRERPDAELLLVDPGGPEGQRLRDTPGVRLVPRSVDAATEIFRTSWTSVLCSEREAFGLVLIESLACGTPVVGTRDGAIPEIIDGPEIGRLFEGSDARRLANALAETLELSEDPSTEQACRERAARFSIERSAREHEDLFRELVKR